MKDIANKKSSAPEIIGHAYEDLKELVRKYAASDQPVLFVGETGTGKELFAKLYIAESRRTGKKMTTNCAAESDTLLRSEIFGHVKGAFTDAKEARKGKISECDGGILFLDEIGDASPAFQAAILRVSEGNSYTPLGSDKEITGVNTLIIAATCRPHNIREDLKMRFQVLPIPPLQAFDIPLLATHFLKGRQPWKKIVDELVSRKYPGNVRELKKTCEKLITEKGDRIFVGPQPKSYPAGSFDYDRFRTEMETWDRYIQPILERHRLGAFFKYTYQPWDDRWLNERKTAKRPALISSDGGPVEYKATIKEAAELYVDAHVPSNAQMNQHFPQFYLGKTFNYSMPYLVEMLLKGYDTYKIVPTPRLTEMDDIEPDEIVLKFKRSLLGIVESGTVPYLLRQLHAKLSKNRASTEPSRPSLSEVFDLPLPEAESMFIQKYGNYQLNRYRKEADFSQAIGINKKSMRQRIKRAKI